MQYFLCILAVGSLLGGCTTVRQSAPQRTASEELLISHAADRAAAQLKLDVAPGTAVFVDTTYFDTQSDPIASKYALGAIREHFAQSGARLVDAKAGADLVVEVRAGALSANERNILLGIPSIPIPTPITGTATFSTPEISLFKSQRRTGIAAFAAAAYRVSDGKLVSTTGVQFGTSHESSRVILIIFASGKQDYMPRSVK